MEYIDSVENIIKESVPTDWLSWYNWAIANGNPNAKKFPIMNPFHAILITIVYLMIIGFGQVIMKNRKRFEVYYFSLLHNGMMVLLSSYMTYEIIYQAIAANYSFVGNGVDSTINGMPMARVLWLFYFSKPIEFIDTIIMVLKKNNRQISFLHVYHHVATFLIWWGVIFYAPGGDTYFSACQNAFVHVLMYSHYFLATLKVPAPWKRYLTQIQMFQFLLNMGQALYVMFFHTAYPRALAYVLFFYMISLLILFGNFYIKSNAEASANRRAQKKD